MGLSVHLDERARLIQDQGDCPATILRNHGLLVTGRTVPEAFLRLYRLERSCQVQIDAAAAGTLNLLGDNVARKSGAELDEFTEEDNDHGALEYAALLRKLDKTDTTYWL